MPLDRREQRVDVEGLDDVVGGPARFDGCEELVAAAGHDSTDRRRPPALERLDCQDPDRVDLIRGAALASADPPRHHPCSRMPTDDLRLRRSARWAPRAARASSWAGSPGTANGAVVRGTVRMPRQAVPLHEDTTRPVPLGAGLAMVCPLRGRQVAVATREVVTSCTFALATLFSLTPDAAIFG